MDPATICGWLTALLVIPLPGVVDHLQPLLPPPAVVATASPTEAAARAPAARGGPATGCRCGTRTGRAVVDRVVDGTVATLLLGPAERELHLPADVLPEGATDGSWLVLDASRGVPTLDPDLTGRRRQTLHDRLHAIREGRSGGRIAR